MKKNLIKLGGLLASFGLLVTTLNANVACICFIYQPSMPENAKKLRRF